MSIWVVFVNALLVCVFALLVVEELFLYIFSFEKINSGFVELSLIHFSWWFNNRTTMKACFQQCSVISIREEKNGNILKFH